MKLVITLIFMMTIACMETALAKWPISCSTPQMSKTFVIDNNTVTFMHGQSRKGNREIASIMRTKSSGTGFSKITSFEGYRYTIHIADTDNFDPVNDYILIRSREGHEITYPLSCK